MMKALIVHRSLSHMGGAVRVALAMVEALNNIDIEAHILQIVQHGESALDDLSASELERVTKASLKRHCIHKLAIHYKLLKKVPPRTWAEILHLSLVAREVQKVINNDGYDLIINNVTEDYPLIPSHVVYIHSPHLVQMVTPSISSSNSFIRKMYWSATSVSLRNLYKKSLEHRVLLANSRYTAYIVGKALNLRLKPIVVYPPINVEKYVTTAKVTGRSNAVVTVSRISRSKKLHIIPYLALYLPKLKFYIIGRVATKENEFYYHRLQHLIDRLHLNNVELVINATEEKKIEILAECKVLLHLMPREHFGIAVAEGLAAGCVPVVHRSGGPWYDIVRQGAYGVSFVKYSVKEIANAINLAISMWSPQFLQKVRAVIRKFDKNAFIERFTNIVKTIVAMTSK